MALGTRLYIDRTTNMARNRKLMTFFKTACAAVLICCISASPKELRFLIIGDWGGIFFSPYDTPIEQAVAREMGIVAETMQTKFTVALGDNFYELGVYSVDDKRFQETFEDIFVAKSLMTPWYFCAGNHDHYGNTSAQIAYSNKSERWNFPNFYYSKSWNIPGTEQELQLVLLDTVILCGNTRDDDLHSQPKGPESLKEAETQWQWLESVLRSSSAHYLLVGGHFPVWSIAEHGPTSCLVERLKPLLEKYQVTAYISGHDHNLQHLKEKNSTVEYFISGSSSRVQDSREHEHSVPPGSSLFFWADESELGGFAVASASSKNMNITFIDAQGKELYHRMLAPRIM